MLVRVGRVPKEDILARRVPMACKTQEGRLVAAVFAALRRAFAVPQGRGAASPLRQIFQGCSWFLASLRGVESVADSRRRFSAEARESKGESRGRRRLQLMSWAPSPRFLRPLGPLNFFGQIP